MAKIDITKTELIWPGKYDDDGRLAEPPRVNLPFQVIETINEGRASREAATKPAQTSLFDIWKGDEGETFEDGWKNKLIWGDNLPIMSSLLEKFAGKVDLIYIDPPFATGADFSFSALVGDDGDEVEKEQSAIEERAYRDTWRAGLDSYLTMLSARLSIVRDLLAETGSLLVHCDYRVMHHVGALLDAELGLGDRGAAEDQAGFRNEIVWMYGLGGSSPKCYPKKHDSILWYSRSKTWFFDPPMVPATSQRMKGQDKKCPDTWDIPSINNMAGERTGYATQKPEALLERVVRARSASGALVADFFCGSGTTLVAAEKLGRRWIGCDLGRFAIHTTRKRLLGIEGCRPFEVLNLGKYERQYWQTTLGRERQRTERTFLEYITLILRLYKAEPFPGSRSIHGKVGSALVHVGSVDAPVTIEEISQCIEEAKAFRATELHVLGWEWEMGLNDLMAAESGNLGVRLVCKQIPRDVMEEQAVDKGDVVFFELAYLKAAVNAEPGRNARVELQDFAIRDLDLIPANVREQIAKWSDYIDYWAVDWDFQNDTFMNGWQTYRTRKDRRLDLVSASHTYSGPGTYNVMVKVVDVFGNDTSRIYPVEIRD